MDHNSKKFWNVDNILEKTYQIPKLCVNPICSVCLGIFQLKIILKNIFSFVKKKSQAPKKQVEKNKKSLFDCWH